MGIRHKLGHIILNRSADKISKTDMNMARQQFSDMGRSALKKPVKVVRDMRTDTSVAVRYYCNIAETKDVPLMVYFHGGGFIMGSIDSHDALCRDIARHVGCAVLLVEYSLAPESPYPKAVEEGIEVLDWIKKTGVLDAVDTSRVFLGGDSAGGTIALDIARTVPQDILTGMVLLYPALDPAVSSESAQRYAEGYSLTKRMIRECWEMYMGDHCMYQPFSAADFRALPPVLILGAEKDVLRDEGAAFAKRLDCAGGDVTYRCYENMFHGFAHLPRILSHKAQLFKDMTQFVTRCR